MPKLTTSILLMMFNVVLSFLMFVGNMCEGDDASVQNISDAPRIQFESAIFDFGKITPDKAKRIEKTFTFKNTGTKLLIIEDIANSCGCIATTSSHEVPPGQSGTIKVTLTLESYRGKQLKRIVVSSNDPKQSKTVLEIRGFIESQVVTLPSHIHFGRLTKGMRAKKVVTVMSSASEDLVLKGVECSSEHIAANISRAAQDKEMSPEVEVILLPAMPAGQIDEVLTIRTNNEKNRTLSVGISGVVENEIVPFPNTISFGIVKSGDSPRRSVMLTSKHKAFHILGMKTSSDTISIETLEKGSKKRYQITAQLASIAPKGFFNAKLEIVTDRNDQPVIEIPVYAFIK